MSTKLTKVVANFVSSITSLMSIGDQTGTLVSATDKDGVALPTGKYCMIIDQGLSTEEHLLFTLTGTAMTSIKSVSRQGVQTTGASKQHKAGAEIKITDFSNIKTLTDLMTGVEKLDSATPLEYDGAITPTLDNQLITKKNAEDMFVENVQIDTDTSLGGLTPNDAKIPSQKAVKTYTDTGLAGKVNNTGDENVGGIKTFASSPIVPTPSSATQVANKGYVDGVAIAGAPDAGAAQKGIVKLSVAPAVVNNPIAVGPNDPRIPSEIITTSAGAADEGKTPKLNASGLIDPSMLGIGPIVRVYTTPGSGTWTKPANLKYIKVKMVGGGGAVSGAASGAVPPAGGGGYCEKTYAASALSATETYVVGSGGVNGGIAISASATNSTFKGVTAGRGSSQSYSTGGEGNSNGGTATGGDVNIPGQNGGLTGGGSFMGYGGNSNAGPSSSGGGYGAGASGNTSGSSGSNGTNGIVIIEEYYV